jgi:hypothetical protein
MRNRSSAIAITANAKKKISQDLGISADMSEDVKKEKITHYIEEKLKDKGNLVQAKSRKTDFSVDLPPPQYLDFKKEYYTKGERPIIFHDKATYISSMDKKIIGDIEPYTQSVDFLTFLSQFRNESEVSELEVQDLLNIDYEKIGELKEKTTEYVQAASTLLEQGSREGNDDLLVFFCEKLNDLKRNELNIQIFVNNIEKVDGIAVVADKTRVYFNK